MASEETSKTILSVGLCCLDLVSICQDYPHEDSDQRVLDLVWQRGGNASNSCSVLSLLDVKCEYFGTIANSPEKGFLVEDFAKYGISIEHCVFPENCQTPTSIIIINQKTGSRTILHYNKDLKEVTLDDFKTLPLHENRYSWIHFEGRPGQDQLYQMVEYVNHYNSTCESSNRITVSLELEKVGRDFDGLVALADYIFISKDYALSKGYTTMKETVEEYGKIAKPGATVICPWGEFGATARSSDGKLHHSPAFSPTKVVDTLGAGDTFNAATIAACSRGSSCADAIRFGCQVAGAKCGMTGYSGIRDWYKDHRTKTD